MTDIFICGAGVSIPYHLTIETLDVLERCNTIFSILKPSTKELLPPPLDERFFSLWPYYKAGELRRNVYTIITDTIVSAAGEEGPVAYLTQGNPVFFDSVTQGLIAEGSKQGLAVELRAAVSSIDTILVDLRQDIAPGLQIYEASALILHKIELRTDTACLILQPHVFGTLYVSADHQPEPETYRPLRDYLARFYPPTHELIFITSATSIGQEPTITPFTLQDLGHPKNHPSNTGASLFIPPSRSPDIDSAFLESMLDPLFLSEFYGISPGPDRDERLND